MPALEDNDDLKWSYVQQFTGCQQISIVQHLRVLRFVFVTPIWTLTLLNSPFIYAAAANLFRNIIETMWHCIRLIIRVQKTFFPRKLNKRGTQNADRYFKSQTILPMGENMISNIMLEKQLNNLNEYILPKPLSASLCTHKNYNRDCYNNA